ncbi:MAG: 23S rRNA (adenine(2503)-C(2))-methyltransferase RlmN [Firmicutes bacterium]|nr:23S rRNA (adenine(2503)-C(2))-methyltransferase RlmN [Bacillota bacterium]
MFMKNIFNYSKEMLENVLIANGFKKFMASQVFDWIYQKKIYDIDLFSNINISNRQYLKDTYSLDFIKLEKVEEDVDVKKFLFRLLDGQKIEAVLMYHDYGTSICVSSQVGCNMGCKFCESGRLKKVRNLETYEMVEQIILVEEIAKTKINSVVIMGIGEPFDNYENVMNFIKIINDPKTMAIGARHITVSTCGIVPKIKEFAECGLQINLAISLHAPNDEIRKKIMPIANAYPLSELISVLKDYIAKTNRRVTLEYVMLEGINDSVSCAHELSDLIRGMNVYVNLIAYNETNNIQFKASSKEVIDEFFNTLKKRGIEVTVRRKFGTKISAACGQLRSKEM